MASAAKKRRKQTAKNRGGSSVERHKRRREKKQESPDKERPALLSKGVTEKVQTSLHDLHLFFLFSQAYSDPCISKTACRNTVL